MGTAGLGARESAKARAKETSQLRRAVTMSDKEHPLSTIFIMAFQWSYSIRWRS